MPTLLTARKFKKVINNRNFNKMEVLKAKYKCPYCQRMNYEKIPPIYRNQESKIKSCSHCKERHSVTVTFRGEVTVTKISTQTTLKI